MLLLWWSLSIQVPRRLHAGELSLWRLVGNASLLLVTWRCTQCVRTGRKIFDPFEKPDFFFDSDCRTEPTLGSDSKPKFRWTAHPQLRKLFEFRVFFTFVRWSFQKIFTHSNNQNSEYRHIIRYGKINKEATPVEENVRNGGLLN